MEISDLYEKSTMGDKLKKFFTALINDEDIRQTLRKPSSYDDGELRMTAIQNFMIKLGDIMSNSSIGGNMGYVNSFFVSPFGQNLINHPNTSNDDVIGMTVQECTSVKLEDILQCSDFIDVFNIPNNNKKGQLEDLLSQHTEMSYDDVKKAVEASLLSSKDKKIVFAEVLPAYNFKVCNDFKATWDMFENGYIDFDTLVTKFWNRKDFDKDQNNTDQQNAFRDFASKYTKYAGYKTDNMGDSKSSTENMISGLMQKGVIADNDTQNLKDQIDNAADVGIFGIIVQFLSNLFSKDKTAFQSIQKIKQDRVISNLKPLSGILRQAAERNKEGSDKLI